MNARRQTSAVGLVAELLRRYPDIQYLRLRTYPPKSAEPRAVAPFTLDRALRHERSPERLVPAPQRPTASALRKILDPIAAQGLMVGLCSRFEMRSGLVKHGLLMDFRCEKSPEALNNLQAACGRMGYAGWLLETSVSYHFYGDDLVDDRDWLRFMAWWLLLENLADVRFIGHCILEQVSCLRLTGNDTFPEPRVAARVGAPSATLQKALATTKDGTASGGGRTGTADASHAPRP